MIYSIRLLFLLALLTATIGVDRGWISVRATTAGGRTEVDISVDGDSLMRDTAGAVDRLGEVSAATAARIRAAAWHTASRGVVAGRVTAIDAVSGRVEVEVAGGEKLFLDLDGPGHVLADGEDVTVRIDGQRFVVRRLETGGS